jgi:hypothetical protein
LLDRRVSKRDRAVSYSLPLTNAVTRGDEQAVSALLANGADVNETTGGGQTALILAVIFGHTNLVKLLMKAGADPHQRDNLGLNALEWAQRRGLAEAVAILTNGKEQSTPPRRIVIPLEEPQHAAPEKPADRSDEKESVSEAEKSLRWIAGFKQRLHEQELRRLNRNEPPLISPEPQKATPIVEPPKAKAPEPQPEPEPAPAPAPPPAAAPAPMRAVTPPPRILTPPTTPPAKTGTRKRCPRCNAIYNSDLVAYCAHHIVPLVDADDPIISEPPRNLPWFWILLIVTLAGSIVAGSLITTYLYKSRQSAARAAAERNRPVQKGLPEVGGELVGKSVLLPEAECPVKGAEPVTGTVTVRVMVDKTGQVYWARGAGGDWLLRGCATEAAMKSTFAPEKLRGRENEGTITYTFKP